MVPTEEIWDEARRRGICVNWLSLKNRRGFYYQDATLLQRRQAIIYLDPTLKESEVTLRTVLAHEIGHDATVGGTSLVASESFQKIEQNRNEYLANRWTSNFLIGPKAFWSAVCEQNTFEDMAEIFGVELWLIDFASKMYSEVEGYYLAKVFA